jgi:hypothetical protein
LGEMIPLFEKKRWFQAPPCSRGERHASTTDKTGANVSSQWRATYNHAVDRKWARIWRTDNRNRDLVRMVDEFECGHFECVHFTFGAMLVITKKINP